MTMVLPTMNLPFAAECGVESDNAEEGKRFFLLPPHFGEGAEHRMMRGGWGAESITPPRRLRTKSFAVDPPRNGEGKIYPAIFEKSATVRVAARMRLSNFRRFSRSALSSAFTVTLSKKASTGARNFEIAAIAASKSSFFSA